MEVVPLQVPGVFAIDAKVSEDARGFFLETYRVDAFERAGLRATFVQDNHSRSRRGTLRGLHFQHPRDQVKLCRVVQGEVFDVCVDVRRGSPTFGRAAWTTLSAANKRQMWIPVGFAHGFCVVSETAEFVYKCSDYYSPENERGILWNDPALEIPWPTRDVILSPKDTTQPRLADAVTLPEYRAP